MSWWSKAFGSGAKLAKIRQEAHSDRVDDRTSAATEQTEITGKLPGSQWSDTLTSLGGDAANVLGEVYGKGPVGPAAAPAAPVATTDSGLPSWAPYAGGAALVVGLALILKR